MGISSPALRSLLTAALLAVCALPASAATSEPSSPAVQPEGVTAIHEDSAQLSATVSPMGLPTAYVFQWGPTTEYGSSSPLVVLEERLMPLRVKFVVTGLQPGRGYHWRVVAANALGNAFGADRSFTTDGEENGPQGREDAAEPTPPPQRSQSAVAARSSGRVRIRFKGAKGFQNLSHAASIPFGSVIDARRGRVKVVTALDDAGTTQTATFRRWVFELRQPSGGDGTVDVVMRGGNFARRCRGQRARASRLPARDRRRIVRRLWASDRHGRFRMHGRNSVATVRGTRWEMVDRCDGTLTRVMSGAVDVRDRRTGRTVRIRAGRTHLSRARG
jgi:hypothetical protein